MNDPNPSKPSKQEEPKPIKDDPPKPIDIDPHYNPKK